MLKTISFFSDPSMEILLAFMKLCANGNVFQQKKHVEWRIIVHRTGGKRRRRRWKYINRRCRCCCSLLVFFFTPPHHHCHRFCHRKCNTLPHHHRHRFCHRKCRGQFCRLLQQNCCVIQTHAQIKQITFVIQIGFILHRWNLSDASHVCIYEYNLMDEIYI